ncbi:MAG: guanylate kinase [Calditrichaeota bacterium]|nr:MAG: guanylate kinase [Calditrichota bacterium]
MAKGFLVVISAPSGGGKTTIIRKVLENQDPDFQYSISVTTRPRRLNEQNGKDYYFIDTKTFKQKKQAGEFVEWAEVHGHYYATPRKPLDQWLKEGKIVFLDLDVQGGLEIKKKYGESAVLIFVKPPSRQRLVERLKNRKTESDEQIAKRLERFPVEMEQAKYYDYQIVNENLEDTVKEVLRIVQKHRESLIKKEV